MGFLADKLNERRAKGNIRSLQSQTDRFDFVSNDYLGLSNSNGLASAIKTSFEKTNYPNGGTGSRLLSGNHECYEKAEAYLSEIFKAESTLIFNSGYAANQALVSSVADKGDTILYDQLAHVCLKEGAWLSKADTLSFLHNDLNDLESRLQRAKGRVFVLTETVFSMDGDLAPIEEILDLCEKYEAYLIVDEAHSTGVFGEAGSGYLVDKNLHERVFARVYTFGKAMGVHGACVAGAKVLADYLVNFGRPFIYTTSLPPHSVVSIEESFRWLEAHQSLQQDLAQKISLFRSHWDQALSHTAIQPILIGSNEQARKISSQLQADSFDVRPILSPTVQRGTERLRISLHTHNEDEVIIALCKRLEELV
ncbi:MAG: 8-amino-7-oxononanoate synthase [Marinoscillum sp.]|jgi:8-amino-7-oxononanoate synthase